MAKAFWFSKQQVIQGRCNKDGDLIQEFLSETKVFQSMLDWLTRDSAFIHSQNNMMKMATTMTFVIVLLSQVTKV